MNKKKIALCLSSFFAQFSICMINFAIILPQGTLQFKFFGYCDSIEHIYDNIFYFMSGAEKLISCFK